MDGRTERWRRYLPDSVAAGQIVARVGLISDTHLPQRQRAIPAAAFDVLAGVDLVLHAGDVGELRVLDQLSRVAPIVAVHGNDDTVEAQRELPYQQVVVAGGQRIFLYHSHSPDPEVERAQRQIDAWEPKLARRAEAARRAGASVVVYGHTHVPMAREVDGVLVVNPGAIAPPNAYTRHRLQTVALLYVLADAHPIVVHVDLAASGRPYVPRIDWGAGFQAACSALGESLLASDLSDVWSRVVEVAQSVHPAHFDAFRQALLRVAHRCWAGEQPLITRADLLVAIDEEPGLSPSAREQLRAALSVD